MQNAHLRLGLLEYHRMTEKTSTRIRLRVDRYVGEDEQAHLISVFGNDSDVGAITAAVHEKAAFHADLSGRRSEGGLSRRTCLLLQGSRELVGPKASSPAFGGGVGGTIHKWRCRADDIASIPAGSSLGDAGELSRTPRGTVVGRAHLSVVEADERIKTLDGIGCQPVLISATTEKVLEWIGNGLKSQALSFPEKNGPIIWPNSLGKKGGIPLLSAHFMV